MTKWFDTNYHYLVPRLSRRASGSQLTENRPLAHIPGGAGSGLGGRARFCSAPYPSCC